MSVRHVAVEILLWLGVALCLVSSIGLFVMRDVYDRLHLSAPVVLAAVLIAAAVLVKDSFSLVGDKALLIAVFLLIASPVLTHAIARAARIDEQGDWRIRRGEGIEVEDP